LENPSDIEASYRLGILNWDHNPHRGRSATETIPYLEVLQELDPRYHSVFQMLRFAYIGAGDADGLAESVRMQFEGEVNGAFRYIIACGQDDIEQQQALADETNLMNWSSGGQMYLAIMVSGWPDNHLNTRAHFQRVAAVEFPEVDRVWIDLLLAHNEAGMGRWEESKAIIDKIPETYALHVKEHQALLMAAPALGIPTADIEEMIRTIEGWPADDPGFVFDKDSDWITYIRFQSHYGLHDHIRLYLLAILNSRLGRGEAAETYATRLDTFGLHDASVDQLAVIEDLRNGAHASIEFAKGDFEGSLDYLEKLSRGSRFGFKYSAIAFAGHERFLRAMALEQLGRPEEALQWYATAFEGTEMMLPYSAPAHFRQAKIYEQLDDPKQAAAHYELFLRAYGESDPRYRPMVDEATERLAALQET